MTVFEIMQEEETKILSSLFLVIDSWQPALALYKPLDSSWRGQFLRPEPTLFPSPPAENYSHLSISSKLSVFFHLALVGREGRDFGQQQDL